MNNLMTEAIAVAASVDRKAHEQGIIELQGNLKFHTGHIHLKY